MKTKNKNKNINLTITVIALFSVLIHLLVYRNLEYHRDELLYFSLGLHPAFGYATVPPMIGWIAWLMQNIPGTFKRSYGIVSLRYAGLGGTCFPCK
jgi:hypothetical protein